MIGSDGATQDFTAMAGPLKWTLAALGSLFLESQGARRGVSGAVKRVVQTLAMLLCLGVLDGRAAAAAADAALMGVVCDTHGTPQMGALVELMGADASVVARAFTDEHGRYALNAVLPGHYQLRASAAFLVPVLRSNLRLQSGAQAVANLTMTAIFDAGTWLPTETRRPGTPTDDWKWTLRSTANRPLLRMVGGDPDPHSVMVSSSAEHAIPPESQGQLAVLSGDGSFAQGGTHQVLSMDRANGDGEVSMLKADLGSPAVSSATASLEVAAGFERDLPTGGGTRIVAGMELHPELQTAGGDGLQVVHLASTEKLMLGDAVMIDAGTLVTAERLLATRLTSAPYFRIAVTPTSGTTIEYRFATERALQSSEDLDRMAIPMDVLSDPEGRPLSVKGMHQEIRLRHTEDSDTTSVAIYRDTQPVEAVEGVGQLTTSQLAGLPIIADAGTGTFLLAHRGYTAHGIAVSWTHAFSSAVSACVEGDLGTVLERSGDLTVADMDAGLRPHTKPALSAGLHATGARTGTNLRAEYRWQPRGTVGQVDRFDVPTTEAYLSFFLKQKLWAGHRLQGIDAVVEATNLLEQGYEPMVGPDGQTLFLAQVPRAVQGGLLFSF